MWLIARLIPVDSSLGAGAFIACGFHGSALVCVVASGRFPFDSVRSGWLAKTIEVKFDGVEIILSVAFERGSVCARRGAFRRPRRSISWLSWGAGRRLFERSRERGL